MDLKGSKTEKNLLAAFAGESQARTKYYYYETEARKAGSTLIADVFKVTAANETAHAKLWFKLLNGGMPKTSENLADAAAGEHYEWSDMYAEFAKEAREEGFEQIAKLFDAVAVIEKQHWQRYTQLESDLKNNSLLEGDEQTEWICAKCGYVHKGNTPPEVCPVCAHSKGYFVPNSQYN